MSSTRRFTEDASPSCARRPASLKSEQSGQRSLQRPKKVPPPMAEPPMRSNLPTPSTRTMLTPEPMFTKMNGNRASAPLSWYLLVSPPAGSSIQQTFGCSGRSTNHAMPWTTTASSSTGCKMTPRRSLNRGAYLYAPPPVVNISSIPLCKSYSSISRTKRSICSDRKVRKWKQPPSSSSRKQRSWSRSPQKEPLRCNAGLPGASARA
mmetsp:Transcript_37052/g.106704  ORF Transcript_37052/g.106704 Transcript_37052/m.106704 type:complete len:207 (+) Transcript_37052:399-1019(+)